MSSDDETTTKMTRDLDSVNINKQRQITELQRQLSQTTVELAQLRDEHSQLKTDWETKSQALANMAQTVINLKLKNNTLPRYMEPDKKMTRQLSKWIREVINTARDKGYDKEADHLIENFHEVKLVQLIKGRLSKQVFRASK